MADIFQYEGEARFRVLERQVLEELIASGEDLIVSTGGGLPAWEDNMARMNATGRTVYIRLLGFVARLTPYGRQKRPTLRGLDDSELIAFMRRNMAEREPFYRQAHLTLDAAHMSDEQMIEKIMIGG